MELNRINGFRVNRNWSNKFMMASEKSDNHKGNSSQNQESKEMSNTTKYAIGAAALAAIVIGGIYIYRRGHGKTPKTESSPNINTNHNLNTNQTNNNKNNHNQLPKIDYFKKYLNALKPEFDITKKIEHKVGTAKRVDEVLYPADIYRSTFYRKDNSIFCTVDWDYDGNVVYYKVMNKNGDTIRELADDL